MVAQKEKTKEFSESGKIGKKKHPLAWFLSRLLHRNDRNNCYCVDGHIFQTNMKNFDRKQSLDADEDLSEAFTTITLRENASRELKLKK